MSDTLVLDNGASQDTLAIDNNQDASRQKFLLDAGALPSPMSLPQAQDNFDALGHSAAGRLLVTTGEGLFKYAPEKAWDALVHDVNHPAELAGKAGAGLLFGVGMRLLLPESGALTAMVGAGMSYLLLKDAAVPTIKAYRDSYNATDIQGAHQAAMELGNGVGQLIWDAGVTMAAGAIGGGLTGFGLKSTGAGRRLESWKDLEFNSPEKPIGRLLSFGQARTAPAQTNFETGFAVGDASGAPRPKGLEVSSLPSVDAFDRAKFMEIYLKTLESNRMYRSPDWSTHLDRQLGVEPVAPGRVAEADIRAAGTGVPDPTFNVGVEMKMARAYRDRFSRVTAEQMAVTDVKEALVAPLGSTMRVNRSPLDPEHFKNNEMLIGLIKQIKTKGELDDVGSWLDHYRTANVQLELAARGDLPALQHLNAYSASMHSNLLSALDRNGIPRSVLRGTNPPLFTYRDTEGAGPYTFPAQAGTSDSAVITYPREYQGLEGIHVGGNYAHEWGHSVYADLLQFPNDLRDHVLTRDVVGRALQQANIPDETIDWTGFPGTKIRKSDFFVRVLKANKEENTADMFSVMEDPTSALANILDMSSLRMGDKDVPPGSSHLIETRGLYGRSYRKSPDNNLGIEEHGINLWRVKLMTETLRQLAPGDRGIEEYVLKVNKLADEMAAPGDTYTWANDDIQGSGVSVPRKEWDAVIPALVKAQLDTPLDVLKGKPLRDLAPDVGSTFKRVDALSKQMADAAIQGKDTIPGFNKAGYRVEDVFSAGTPAWMEAIGRTPVQGAPGYVNEDILLTRINQISANLRSQYAGDTFTPAPPGGASLPNNPMPAPGSLHTATRFKFLSPRTPAGGWTPSALSLLPDWSARHAIRFGAYGAGTRLESWLSS